MKLFTAMCILVIVLTSIPLWVWLVGRLVGLLFHYRLAFAPFGYAALVMAVLMTGLLSYGFALGKYRMEVTHQEVTSARISKAFDGYKIAHISDLHLSTFLKHPEKLQRIVDSINSQQPDLICFTGDLVSLRLEETDSLSHILCQLKAKDGVVSVLGNHDFFIYSRQFPTQAEKDAAVLQLADFQRSIGWQLLRNQHIEIVRDSAKINVVGVDNIHGDGQGFATINHGNLPLATQGSDTALFTLLLSHDPSHWNAEVRGHTNIDLTLSGHTHAAQIRFFGWTPASLMFEQAQGLYQAGNQYLYVNRGLGCTLPLRIGCPAEITMITLRSK